MAIGLMSNPMAIPSAPLLSRLNWRCLGKQVAAELTNRERHSPVVSSYRWWARRPHSVMGGLLDAAVAAYGQDIVVADPFSGGGTVTFEAARRGLRAYAQDLYPWPARGLAAALAPCDPAELRGCGSDVLAAIAGERASYRNATTGAELTHILRVRVSTCTKCDHRTWEFPAPLVSVRSRGVGETRAYFGCRACGGVTLRGRDAGSFVCPACARRWSTSCSPTGCAHCDDGELRLDTWQAVLVQELFWAGEQPRARLRPVLPGDPVDLPATGHVPPALAEAIPDGIETRRLVSNGFRTWAALYSGRQLHVLQRALAAVQQLNTSQAVKDRLAFAVLGAAEMPALLSRWDRFHLKPFEGTANHRYTPTPFCVEANLLSPVGRGTLAKRLEKVADGHEWLFQDRTSTPRVVSSTTKRRGRRHSDWDVLVTTGSSSKQLLPDQSVTVVLTDPPYFDDVQYGELARLFHAWLRTYDPTVAVDEASEAVPNTARGTSAADYEQTIAACLRESRRTLKTDGALVLTFHNKKLAAWKALAGAIAHAGFHVRALAVVKAENGGDHCKRTVKAMLHDLVVECGVARNFTQAVQLEFRPRSVEEKNLAAIGLALARCVAEGSADGMRGAYLSELERLGARPQIA